MQIMALRLRQQGIQVFILAPLKGHEFAEVCNMIGGKYIRIAPSSMDCINIMETEKELLILIMKFTVSDETIQFLQRRYRI